MIAILFIFIQSQLP